MRWQAIAGGFVILGWLAEHFQAHLLGVMKNEAVSYLGSVCLSNMLSLASIDVGQFRDIKPLFACSASIHQHISDSFVADNILALPVVIAIKTAIPLAMRSDIVECDCNSPASSIGKWSVSIITF